VNRLPIAFRILLPAALVLLGGMAGCGTVVTVDALAKPGASSVSYKLHNANPELEENSLRYREGANYIRTALSGRGLFEAPPGVTPDVIVSVEFDVSPPKTHREPVLEPITKVVPGPRHSTSVPTGTDTNGNPTYEVVTWQESDKEVITGYREGFITTTVYEKHLQLVARESSSVAHGRAPAEIWMVDVTSEGKSHDLRKQLPLLVAATIDFIGEDSKGQKKIRLNDTDADVLFVKKGMPPTAALSN